MSKPRRGSMTRWREPGTTRNAGRWTLLLIVTLMICAPAPTRAVDDPDRAGPAKVRVVLVGDSTVADGSGWGPGFARRLGPGAVCLNMARSGRSSRSYADE